MYVASDGKTAPPTIHGAYGTFEPTFHNCSVFEASLPLVQVTYVLSCRRSSLLVSLAFLVTYDFFLFIASFFQLKLMVSTIVRSSSKAASVVFAPCSAKINGKYNNTTGLKLSQDGISRSGGPC